MRIPWNDISLGLCVVNFLLIIVNGRLIILNRRLHQMLFWLCAGAWSMREWPLQSMIVGMGRGIRSTKKGPEVSPGAGR